MKNLILKLQINSNDSTREIRLTCSFLLVYNVLKLTSEQLVLSVAEASERQVKTFHFSLFTPNSSLPTPNSSLPTPNSSLPTPHSSLLTPHSSLPTPHSQLLTPNSSLLTPHSPLLTPHSSLLTPHISDKNHRLKPTKSLINKFNCIN